MIERNLGNAERLVRLMSGLLMLIWASQQLQMNAVDWFVVIVAVALVLNGIFSRCYLWYVLDINTCRDASAGCQPDSTYP
ncbi:MAG: DUF2892 domain-containing protein [Halieaceae bacterium]|jgi:hypothetical protein|nr:DUF2892 domain-containing protein [Halieaceae bacterium]